MHIGIDASRLATTARTGTERYSYEIIGALARLDRRNPYTLYCNGLPAALPPLGTNVTVRSLPFPRLWTHLRLGWEMQRHPPDVLFIPAHVVPSIHPPRTVVTIHDLGYLAFPEAHTRARRLDLHLSTLWSTRTAHHIIAVSQATRNDLIRRYLVPPTKISVIHHGLSAHFHPPTSHTEHETVAARYGIHGPYLLSVGTVQPRKNLVRLIDAYAQVVRDNAGDTPHLVLAGKRGWLTESIERRATEHGIAERVHFTGYVDDADLPALLGGAVAFVFPSLYEGFGFPVLEAMACGTPVLTSTTSSLPEVAGDAALLVDPHNTHAIAGGLVQLITDAALRTTLRERGLARAARFTWERCAQETHHVVTCAATEKVP